MIACPKNSRHRTRPYRKLRSGRIRCVCDDCGQTFEVAPTEDIDETQLLRSDRRDPTRDPFRKPPHEALVAQTASDLPTLFPSFVY